MKLAAAAVVALIVAIVLAGCGDSADDSTRAETVNVTLPASAPARATITATATGTPRVPARAPTTVRGSAPAATTPEVTPLAPQTDARLNGVAVWVPYWSLPSAERTAIDNANIVKVAHPFMDEITGTATVVDQSGGEESGVAAELAAKGITVIPTVTETDEMGAFLATLTHPRRSRALLDALVGIAETGDNEGIDLDFEDMAVNDGNVARAERLAVLYPRFVARLCQRLHADNRSCEVTVMAKTDAGRLGTDGLDTYVYDYAALAKVADRVQLMAYDDHVPSGAAGPIAPWPWVLSVLDYAMSQVPAEKLVLGIPSYGYDWSSEGGGTSLTAPAAEALAVRMKVPIGWSETDAEPTFSYSTGKRRHRVTHTVWFEDATADYDRAVLAADDKLAGVDLWAAGDEDPHTWTMLAKLR